MVELYFATSRTSGKSYCGITSIGVGSRWAAHVRSASAPTNKFHWALSQYGSADFEVVVLFVYPTWKEACDAERSIISALALIDSGYNTMPGGDGGPTFIGRSHSLDIRAAMSAASKGRPKSSAHRVALSAAKLGKPVLPATLAKAIAANTGARRKPFSAEWLYKLSRAAKARGLRQNYATLRMPLTAIGVSPVEITECLYAVA